MYIDIRVVTRQKKEAVFERKPGYFDISVREKPEQNMVNRRILELVAQYFSIPVSSVRIVSGHHKPSKIFDIRLPAGDS